MIPTQTTALRAESISDPADLARLASHWDRLVTACPNASIFQTWEWVDAWWRHFGKGRRLLVFCVWSDGQLVGIAPFSIKRHLNLPFRKLEFLGTGLSDTLDILIHPSFSEQGPPLVSELILQSGHLWDMADFQQMSENSQLMGVGWNASGGNGLAIHPFPQEVCPVVLLPGNWGDYQACLSKKMRSNIGYYERLMRREFDLEIGVADEANLEAEMEAFFKLHQRRWRGKRLPGVLGGDGVQKFHREVARRFLERGRLRLYYLKLDGVTRASLYCFHFGKRALYYLGGFDPDFGRYSPGTVLTAHAIREAIAAGMEEFDFLRGHEAYKYRWEPVDRVNSRLLVVKSGLRSQLMLRLNILERQLEALVKTWALKWQERN